MASNYWVIPYYINLKIIPKGYYLKFLNKKSPDRSQD